MSQLTLKEVTTSISKGREMRGAPEDSLDPFSLCFHVVKLYRLSAEIKDTMDILKKIILKKCIKKTFFWEDELKVFIGNKNATSTIDVRAVYNIALKEGLEKEFFAACSISESAVDNIVLKAAILTNKTVTPGEENAELKISKITKEERLAVYDN